jgi:hypothetical protein
MMRVLWVALGPSHASSLDLFAGHEKERKELRTKGKKRRESDGERGEDLWKRLSFSPILVDLTCWTSGQG